MAHWYCKKCKSKKEPSEVSSFKKKCKDCGTEVKWIDVTRGMLFNSFQGDFYELTGQKPLCYIDGKQFGVMEYVIYLENRLQKCESK